MQKQFNAVINGKGGVGKSFFAVNFVQFLKDNNIAHIAVDTDNENSTLKRFHPEALFLNIADPTEIDSVFAMLDKTDLVVMDCRAAIHDDQIRFVQHGENRINFGRVGDIEKQGFGMKPFQRRIFVVGINGDVGDVVIFEELDKIDGEETFADAALAVDDGIELFLHIGF